MRSLTGANLRRIMLLAGRSSVEDLKNDDIPYHLVAADDAWKVGMVKELLAITHGDLDVPGLLQTELDYILEYMCTQ